METVLGGVVSTERVIRRAAARTARDAGVNAGADGFDASRLMRVSGERFKGG